MKKWIRIPGLGEMRGEGRWLAVSGERMEADFAQCKRTGYLPVGWEVPDHVRVFEQARPDVWPQFVVQDGVLIHQLHLLAVPVAGVGDAALRYNQLQLVSLIKSLTVEGANVA